MVVIVYFTSITTTTELDKNQIRIRNTLEAFKIPHKFVDLAADASLLEEMRNKVGNRKAMAPQIFNDDKYCGDFAAFEEAMESEKVEEFFKSGCQQNK
ncbi:SH3 domain-binding glutamic acid-rich-like protein 2-A [Scyliorhinus canicula]|uniref:SH3 domain-binding glutamic acid-rich-like protein 2-A n=1 Tax=Scyliorhinus canicula TaxID=7830 RepID=UPI0018F58612|nr:SH3 domain-binding glutamic acid-rich-like protein 2-A [Scyliorhinus canicula]